VAANHARNGRFVTSTAIQMARISEAVIRAPSSDPFRGFRASVSWSKMSFTP